MNKKEIYFARSIFKNAEIILNTVQNAKDIAVFDSTLQEDRRGSKTIWCEIRLKKKTP